MGISDPEFLPDIGKAMELNDDASEWEEPVPVHVPFPKIPRLTGGMVITEKIDGTNAAVVVTESGTVYAQSRTRIVTPDNDNYGFAAWVEGEKDELARFLGPGVHFGEWWGEGIQRGYGIKGKRFSLFNSGRWNGIPSADYRCAECLVCFVVPVLYNGPFSTEAAKNVEAELRGIGSAAAPGFMNPEGIVIFDTAGRNMYKLNDAKQGEKHGTPSGA